MKSHTPTSTRNHGPCKTTTRFSVCAQTIQGCTYWERWAGQGNNPQPFYPQQTLMEWRPESPAYSNAYKLRREYQTHRCPMATQRKWRRCDFLETICPSALKSVAWQSVMQCFYRSSFPVSALPPRERHSSECLVRRLFRDW
jgi:hypothetical protein